MNENDPNKMLKKKDKNGKRLFLFVVKVNKFIRIEILGKTTTKSGSCRVWVWVVSGLCRSCLGRVAQVWVESGRFWSCLGCVWVVSLVSLISGS